MPASVTNQQDNLIQQLEQTLISEKSCREDLLRLVAQAPFVHDRDMALLFLGFISFFVLDDDGTTVKPGGVTDNDYYRQSITGYEFDFSKFELPMTADDNSVVQAIKSGEPVVVSNWETIRRPDIDEGYARLNQASGGIGCSVVYPLPGSIKGALMFNFFQYPEAIGETQETFMRRYAAIVSNALASFKSPETLPGVV